MRGHVVVVGGGVMGLTSAYYLRKRGYEVTVLERDAADRNTTSHGNAGMVSAWTRSMIAVPCVSSAQT